MKIDYDRSVDAAYFSFSVAASARQEKLDDARIIDYDADGEVVVAGLVSLTGYAHRELRIRIEDKRQRMTYAVP